MKNSKYGAAALLVFMSAGLFAQAAGEVKKADPLLDNSMFWVLISVVAIVFIAALLTMIRVNNVMFKEVQRMARAARGIVEPEVVETPRGDDFWTRMRKKYWEDAVPITQEQTIMGSHEFDGIRELDNNLPPWWVSMFWVTIIFGAVYMGYYEWGGGGPSQKDEYDREMEAARLQKAIALNSAAEKVNEETVVALTDKGALQDGEFIFKSLCAACHGQLGEGGVGPNFTDEYWLHGGGVKDIFKTIKYGVPDKGMISWQSQIKPSDMQKVSSYILSLGGTNPPNPKAPQGVIWKGEAATTDTLKTVKAEVKN